MKNIVKKIKNIAAVKHFLNQPIILKLQSQSSFVKMVILPTMFFACYQIFLATERFESQAKVIVQQPDSMATMDPGMAFLSGLGVPTGGSDAELVKAYIYSNDMIKYLNETLGLRAHYSQAFIDFFSRIHDDDSSEKLYEYYQDHIEVIIDESSGVININSQGFDGEYAQKLTNAIVNRAEWFINSIGHQLAKAQLTFIQGEHKRIEQRLAEAKKQLLIFQQKYNLLDPMAEGMAMQKITYTLEGQIAIKQIEIRTLKAIMSEDSPQVKALINELLALNDQLMDERNKLSKSGQEEISVSEILSRFTDYQIQMELALQAYTSSQISLEKSRIEAYRQMKYLIVV
ncbi:MAG: lipopolysaccharide biosynthesis protein, partial [Colwellia sp.]